MSYLKYRVRDDFTIHLGQFRTHVPTFVPHESKSTIVAMQMIGDAARVNSNWASLMHGGSQHSINTCAVKLGGSKDFLKMTAVLPCGWKEMWLINKQASYKSMEPGKGYFYLLGDGEEMIPRNFYLMLDKALPLPLRSKFEWILYLWEHGRKQRYITQTSIYDSIGLGAWYVITDTDKWARLLSSGLNSNALSF